MPDITTLTAKPGDLVSVSGHRVGGTVQTGEILEVIGGERPHYRVRWDDGHESIYFPGSDATIRPGRTRRRTAGRPQR
jgi:hypothetical protein